MVAWTHSMKLESVLCIVKCHQGLCGHGDEQWSGGNAIFDNVICCCLSRWRGLFIASAVDFSGELLQPSDGAVASETNSSQRLVIWGTDVNVGTCKEKFQVWNLGCQSFKVNPLLSVKGRLFTLAHFGVLHFQRFLQRFIDPSSNEDENAGLDLNEPLYMQKLEEVPRLYSFLLLSAVCESIKREILCLFLKICFLQISVVGDPVLNVNCLHVQSFDAELYRQLISYPQVRSFSSLISTSCDSVSFSSML